MNLDNKVALVTGGASGLGQATVEKFVEKGAKTVILDINEDNANKIIENKLSVRQAENFVQLFKKKRQKSKITKDANIIALELSVLNKIGLNVEIKNNKRHKGKISFEYKDIYQLNKIIDIIKTNYWNQTEAWFKIKS